VTCRYDVILDRHRGVKANQPGRQPTPCSGKQSGQRAKRAIVVRCASTSDSGRGRRRCASEMISKPHGPLKPIPRSVWMKPRTSNVPEPQSTR